MRNAHPPRVTRLRSARPLLLLLGLVLPWFWACGGADDAIPVVCHLTQQTPLELISSVDPNGPASQFAGSKVVLQRELAFLTPGTLFEHDGGWVREDVGPADHLQIIRLPQSKSTQLVELEVDAVAIATHQVFLTEVVDAPATLKLQDARYVRELLGRSVRQPLLPTAGSQGAQVAAVAQGHAKPPTLLLWAALPRASLRSARLRVSTLAPTAAWLLASPPVRYFAQVRTVSHDEITRDAIVLGGQAKIRFQLTVPARRPRLEVALLVKGQSAPVDLHCEVRGRDTVTGHVAIERNDLWLTPFQLDLAPVAGQAVELVLTTTPRNAADGQAIVALGGLVIRGEPMRRDPDVILISLDTVRADRMSLYGAKRPTTPVLDRLAGSSAVFDTAIAAAPWTLPSHATLLSGQYPDHHGVVRDRALLAEETPLLAEDLRRRGYRTLAVTGGGNVSPAFGFGRGFDRYGSADPAGPPPEWVRDGRDLPDSFAAHARNTERARAEVLQMLAAPDPTPLFLFLHTYVAHEYRAGASALRAVGVADDHRLKLARGMSFLEAAKFVGEAATDNVRVSREEDVRALYDATLWHADRLVGEVIEALRQSGRLNHAIVVITSDHGEELFDRGRLGHGKTLYDELVRVPLLIHAPGIAPRRIADVVSGADIAPTILDLLGIAVAQDAGRFDGRSLVPLLKGDRLEPVSAMGRVSVRGSVTHALRSATTKFITTQGADGTNALTQLYVLDQDPGERRDVAGERAEDAARAAAALSARVAELVARRPTNGTAVLSAEAVADLEALGYVGGH